MTGLGLAAGLAVMGVMMIGGHWLAPKGMGHGKTAETAVCPVSGNRVAASASAVQATVNGKVYYFDDERHLRDFVLDPEKFLGRKPGEGGR